MPALPLPFLRKQAHRHVRAPTHIRTDTCTCTRGNIFEKDMTCFAQHFYCLMAGHSMPCDAKSSCCISPILGPEEDVGQACQRSTNRRLGSESNQDVASFRSCVRARACTHARSAAFGPIGLAILSQIPGKVSVLPFPFSLLLFFGPRCFPFPWVSEPFHSPGSSEILVDVLEQLMPDETK